MDEYGQNAEEIKTYYCENIFTPLNEITEKLTYQICAFQSNTC